VVKAIMEMRNKKPTGDDDGYDDDNVSGNVLKVLG
jgi:hypothetical protein